LKILYHLTFVRVLWKCPFWQFRNRLLKRNHSPLLRKDRFCRSPGERSSDENFLPEIPNREWNRTDMDKEYESLNIKHQR
jgi:hypothetical protein